MKIKIHFLGASQNVTGSQYVVEANNQRIMIDCGYYQERALQDRNWEPFKVPPEDLDAVLLTHAHLDHCGLLPKLGKEGLRAKIYCTSATGDIAKIVMGDSAKIQEEDVAFKKKRHKKAGREAKHPYVPLFTVQDAERVGGLMSYVKFETPVRIADGFEATFFESGHILGAASILLKIQSGGETRTLLFSGDIGRNDVPILRDPTVFTSGVDYVVMESTYGDREHPDAGAIHDQLAEVVNQAHRERGNVIIPSFAVERSQELMYYLGELLEQKRIPPTMVLVDSPMAVRVTDVFRRHPELFDEETMERLSHGNHPCDFPSLKLIRTVEQSKAINSIHGTVIIIAGSGMCTGGRIKHHLDANIDRRENTVLFVGYQAQGTLGRQILDGAQSVRLFGRQKEVRAHISQIGGFSGHAGKSELLHWITSIESKPRRAFITHGESEVAVNFAREVEAATGVPSVAPEYESEYELE
ncbi:MBL fold metallo-hydrolase RNA specificity domain-containing protein [Coraliomargarita parva]|uniref:MBL fold metallo-hydrolase RNA specificity domain-containing protein n=1 Tax=Coraliomargarita parva TaxID=3014050 RepID=UPI0022B3316E|nr:MBL fold metallo-hydrolase [Coraliomargarita parva]